MENENILLAHVTALELVVKSLIATHPDRAALLQAFDAESNTVMGAFLNVARARDDYLHLLEDHLRQTRAQIAPPGQSTSAR